MPTLVLALLSAISFTLTLWRWLASVRFPLHRRQAVSTALPPLTILKPLKGCDEHTRQCLRSWLAQDYPAPIQTLFGVASPSDPVCPVVNELMAEFPLASARLVVCCESLGANAKISTLRQLEPHIKNPVLIISDADVHVPPDFAAQAVDCLQRSGAGLVNSFYRFATPSTLAMRWEATAVNADFWTNVLQARGLKPVDFALGAAMTLPAGALKEIGGFAALANYLADDHQLGRQIAAGGRRIEFTTVVAECRDAPMSWSQVWAHQLRWARTIRVCQPAPFFCSIINNSSIWPLALWISIGTAGWPVFAGCAALRILCAVHQESRLTQKRPNFFSWWMPCLKDLFDSLIWISALMGNTIVWRGERFRLRRDGQLEPFARPKRT